MREERTIADDEEREAWKRNEKR